MHADEIETSLMLALAPEFVNMTEARQHYPDFPQNFSLSADTLDRVL